MYWFHFQSESVPLSQGFGQHNTVKVDEGILLATPVVALTGIILLSTKTRYNAQDHQEDTDHHGDGTPRVEKYFHAFK